MKGRYLPYYALTKANCNEYKFSEMDRNVPIYLKSESNKIYKYDIKKSILINPLGLEIKLDYRTVNWFIKFLKT